MRAGCRGGFCDSDAGGDGVVALMASVAGGECRGCGGEDVAGGARQTLRSYFNPPVARLCTHLRNKMPKIRWVPAKQQNDACFLHVKFFCASTRVDAC